MASVCVSALFEDIQQALTVYAVRARTDFNKLSTLDAGKLSKKTDVSLKDALLSFYPFLEKHPHVIVNIHMIPLVFEILSADKPSANTKTHALGLLSNLLGHPFSKDLAHRAVLEIKNYALILLSLLKEKGEENLDLKMNLILCLSFFPESHRLQREIETIGSYCFLLLQSVESGRNREQLQQQALGAIVTLMDPLNEQHLQVLRNDSVVMRVLKKIAQSSTLEAATASKILQAVKKDPVEVVSLVKEMPGCGAVSASSPAIIEPLRLRVSGLEAALKESYDVRAYLEMQLQILSELDSVKRRQAEGTLTDSATLTGAFRESVSVFFTKADKEHREWVAKSERLRIETHEEHEAQTRASEKSSRESAFEEEIKHLREENHTALSEMKLLRGQYAHAKTHIADLTLSIKQREAEIRQIEKKLTLWVERCKTMQPRTAGAGLRALTSGEIFDAGAIAPHLNLALKEAKTEITRLSARLTWADQTMVEENTIKKALKSELNVLKKKEQRIRKIKALSLEILDLQAMLREGPWPPLPLLGDIVCPRKTEHELKTRLNALKIQLEERSRPSVSDPSEILPSLDEKTCIVLLYNSDPKTQISAAIALLKMLAEGYSKAALAGMIHLNPLKQLVRFATEEVKPHLQKLVEHLIDPAGTEERSHLEPVLHSFRGITLPNVMQTMSHFKTELAQVDPTNFKDLHLCLVGSQARRFLDESINLESTDWDLEFFSRCDHFNPYLAKERILASCFFKQITETYFKINAESPVVLPDFELGFKGELMDGTAVDLKFSIYNKPDMDLRECYRRSQQSRRLINKAFLFDADNECILGYDRRWRAFFQNHDPLSFKDYGYGIYDIAMERHLNNIDARHPCLLNDPELRFAMTTVLSEATFLRERVLGYARTRLVTKLIEKGTNDPQVVAKSLIRDVLETLGLDTTFILPGVRQQRFFDASHAPITVMIESKESKHSLG